MTGCKHSRSIRDLDKGINYEEKACIILITSKLWITGRIQFGEFLKITG
jgi:hypothetical protein